MSRGNLYGNRIESREARKRKVSPQDIAELERRAAALAHIPGHGRRRVIEQARAAYALRLDFLRMALSGDFSTWLSKHSGLPRTTCYERWKAGRALAMGSKPTRNQAGLLQEQHERETTPGPDLSWDSEK